MKWHHIYQRQIEWIGILAFVIAFWAMFAASACAIYQAVPL